MKRTYFVCLFLCLTTTFLLSQSNPVPQINQSTSVVAPISASQTDPKAQAKPGRSFRLGTLGNRRSPKKVKPFTDSTPNISESIFCIDEGYAQFDVSSSDSDVGGAPPIDGPDGTFDPNTGVLSAGCSFSFGLDYNGAFGRIGSHESSIVTGRGEIDASCVVATGQCSGTVSVDTDVYSFTDGSGDLGPVWGELDVSGSTTDISIQYSIDPSSGQVYVMTLSASYDGLGSEYVADPVPFISSPLVPSAVVPGSPGFSLLVDGSGFVHQSVIYWNNSPQQTTFVSPTQLTAAVPSENVASSGTSTISVKNPSGGVSNAASLSVTEPTSTLSVSGMENSTASEPESLVAADFNGDSHLDLALASFSGFVSVMLGNGDGTFQGHINYPVGAGARSIVVGNFNGLLDLAVANQAANSVSILLGNGDGTFQSHVDYPVGQGPFSLATGDFNGDGALDLAVVNQSSNTISILLGFGDGTFWLAGSYATGQLPFGIAIGDFNADGNLDLAVANYSDNTVSILLGKGDGTFASHVDYPTSSLPEGVTVADLNGDGKLDLVVGTNQTTAGQISILIGKGDGTFEPYYGYAAGSKPRAVCAADLNGDGQIDLAIANYGSSTISLLLGNGTGTFTPLKNYSTGTSPQSVIAGDFAGNGRLDLATADYGSNTASVLLQTPIVALTPTSLSFGAQAVGTTSSPQSTELTNAGSAPLDITGVSLQGDFAQNNTCSSTLPPGSGCNISVTFTPTASGARTGALTLADNAVNSPQTVSLSGTGTIATTTTLSSSLNPSKLGQAVTLTAVVSSPAGTPTGKIKYLNGTTVLATLTLTSGSAKYTTSKLPPGANSITAVYEGDSNNSGSTSAPVNQFVLAATTTALSSSPNPSAYGQAVTFTASVTSSIGAPPDGETVTFKQGATVLGTGALSGGSASFSISTLGVGTKSVTAVYGGDSNFGGSTSKAVTQVVNKATTTTTLASSLNPSNVGQSVTFTASVAPQYSGTVKGTVTFSNGTTTLKTVALSGGVAKFTTSALTSGTHTITATYNGSTSFTGSSASLTQTVD